MDTLLTVLSALMSGATPDALRPQLPPLCAAAGVDSDELEAFVMKRLDNSALDAAVQALERRAAFVAGEAAHARAALADAMDRTAPEPRSAARGGFFSS